MRLLKQKTPHHPLTSIGDPYTSDDGWTMAREEGLTPNGNQLNNRWVLRDNTGKFIDFDQYRHDLAERNNCEIVL